MVPCPPHGELALFLHSVSVLSAAQIICHGEGVEQTPQRLCSLCALKIRAEASFRCSRLATSNEKTEQKMVKWDWVLEAVRPGFKSWLRLAVTVTVLTDRTQWAVMPGSGTVISFWFDLFITSALVELTLGMFIKTLACPRHMAQATFKLWSFSFQIPYS